MWCVDCVDRVDRRLVDDHDRSWLVDTLRSALTAHFGDSLDTLLAAQRAESSASGNGAVEGPVGQQELRRWKGAECCSPWAAAGRQPLLRTCCEPVWGRGYHGRERLPTSNTPVLVRCMAEVGWAGMVLASAPRLTC